MQPGLLLQLAGFYSCCACLAAAGYTDSKHSHKWGCAACCCALPHKCFERVTAVWAGQLVDASIWIVLSGCGWVALHKLLAPSLLQVVLVVEVVWR